VVIIIVMTKKTVLKKTSEKGVKAPRQRYFKIAKMTLTRNNTPFLVRYTGLELKELKEIKTFHCLIWWSKK
jgi:hypothetical protein